MDLVVLAVLSQSRALASQQADADSAGAREGPGGVATDGGDIVDTGTCFATEA